MISKDKDQALIRLLRQNARMSVTDLAKRLKVSRTTVQQRMERLEYEGTIQGYGVRLGEEYRQRTLLAYVSVEVAPKMSLSVCKRLEQLEDVEALFTVSGKFDLLLQVRTLTPVVLDQLLDDIGNLEGVLRTESSIVLNTKFDRR